MNVGDKQLTTIWLNEDGRASTSFWDSAGRRMNSAWPPCRALDDFATAIRDMWVRGAPLIGVHRRLWHGVADERGLPPTPPCPTLMTFSTRPGHRDQFFAGRSMR